MELGTKNKIIFVKEFLPFKLENSRSSKSFFHRTIWSPKRLQPILTLELFLWIACGHIVP